MTFLCRKISIGFVTSITKICSFVHAPNRMKTSYIDVLRWNSQKWKTSGVISFSRIVFDCLFTLSRARSLSLALFHVEWKWTSVHRYHLPTYLNFCSTFDSISLYCIHFHNKSDLVLSLTWKMWSSCIDVIRLHRSLCGSLCICAGLCT